MIVAPVRNNYFTNFSRVSSYITDGDLISFYHSVDNGAVVNPYLLVDLQGFRFVEKIRVLPVAETLARRFRSIQVSDWVVLYI